MEADPIIMKKGLDIMEEVQAIMAGAEVKEA